MVEATGAAYHSLHNPALMPAAIRDAFLQARAERRPVVLGIPFDLQNRPWEGEVALPAPSRDMMTPPSPIQPAAEDVSRAARLVAGVQQAAREAGIARDRVRMELFS